MPCSLGTPWNNGVKETSVNVLNYRALPLRYTDVNMYAEFYVYTYTYIVEHKSES